ncbi:hypothetical protein HBE96_07740 [Clostridium sp. P21]|uniref:Uncharacterized protein n=1 Tax=Clostridium muellerianum TaxID=2716538 RepID=A0A7Y0EFN2_9CLOT|nr:hypothetical protein [Clostridium muellerianum]NMM62585.1 hypothetical protein [Clostridium muellerianum]
MNYKVEMDKLINASGDILYDKRNSVSLNDLDYEKAIMLLKKAHKIAEENGDIQNQFFITTEIIYASAFINRQQETILDFIWCINNMNKITMSDNIAYNLSWNYKVIADNIYKFSNISLDKIQYIFENMKNFYKDNNMSLKPYYDNKMFAAMCGAFDEKEIDSLYKEFVVTRADRSSNCRLCNKYSKACYHLYKNDVDNALKEAKEILSSIGKCSTAINGVQSHLLLYLYNKGDKELAEKFHLSSIAKINGEKGHFNFIWNHILYLSKVNMGKALKVFEKNYKNSLDGNNSLDKLYFDFSAYLLFSKVLKEGGRSFKARIPVNSPIYMESGEYYTEKVASHFKDNVLKSKEAFDKRNGNDVISRNLNRILDLYKSEKLDDL